MSDGSKTRTLNPHNFGSSRRHFRIHTISKIYENIQGFLRSYKDLSTGMRSSNEFLRVIRILEKPRDKIKIAVSNHNLK